MTITTFALLVLAGVGTGLVGYLTGLASLVSYPALLAAGLSPVSANVTNTVGMIGVGIGSTARAGSELKGGRLPLTPQLIIAAVGGLTGGSLLLFTSESSFETIVPWLIIVASVLVVLSPRLSRLRGAGGHDLTYYIGLFFLAIYGGYFGAGAGVIFLAVCLIAAGAEFKYAMILKSLLLGVTNFVAAILFGLLGPVNWLAALALGLGCMVGGNLGPVVQRRIPEQVLRAVVALCGIGLAIWLWTR